MIKRIIEVQNIGAFSNYVRGGSIGFGKLTFIYGLNTRGKTTLTEILESLKENNPENILSRKSIPDAGIPRVKLSCEVVSGSESAIEFNNGIWNSSEYGQAIEVFGAEFIHKNLFTGLSIERANKVNLTQFILGEEGVSLADEITSLKRDLRQKKSDLQLIKPRYIIEQPSTDLERYLLMDVEELDLEAVKVRLSVLRKTLTKEEIRLSQPEQILSMEEPKNISSGVENIEQLFSETNEFLKKEFKNLSEDGLDKLKNHIEKTFINPDRNIALGWIKNGLDHLKDDHAECVFCGQSLDNVQDLMDAYHSFFSEEYRVYLSKTQDESIILKDRWLAINIDYSNQVSEAIYKMMPFKPIIESTEFNNYLDLILEAKNKLDSIDILEVYSKQKQGVILSIGEKMATPFEAKIEIDFSDLFDRFNTYSENLTSINNNLTLALEIIKNFKGQYEDLDEIRERIQNFESTISSLELEHARLEDDVICQDVLSRRRENSLLAELILKKEGELNDSQSQYLDTYFERLNYHFRLLGSQDFILERKESRRGNKPVYYLSVLFKTEEIEESNISKVFSESDKRALALSIFWSKLDLLSDDEKVKKVIVLDDPVTSFDENRTLRSIKLFKESIDKYCQLIVLTHYPHFIRQYCERGMNDHIQPVYIEIKRDNTGSYLERIDNKKFIQSEYELKFSKIMGFIEREHSQDIRHDLRPFLESLYLPTFFANKLRSAEQGGHSINTLSEKIDWIFDDDEDVKAMFHGLRTNANPDAHSFTSSNEEDIRNFANEMMNNLYSFNYNLTT